MSAALAAAYSKVVYGARADPGLLAIRDARHDVGFGNRIQPGVPEAILPEVEVTPFALQGSLSLGARRALELLEVDIGVRGESRSFPGARESALDPLVQSSFRASRAWATVSALGKGTRRTWRRFECGSSTVRRA